MIKTPVISVVMPVYNVDRYLRQSLDCVIVQSIGFEEKIELILVDDGSQDDSSAICKEYQHRYPKNIVYIKQKNQGVSATRNNGLKLARGKYVNFLDSDDVWSKDALKSAVEFMEAYEEKVDFVAVKIKFFGANIDEHPSNYKFEKTRVIDVAKEPDNPIFHLPTCIFLRTALANSGFDTRLKITEDAKFLSDVLVRKKAYGVISSSAYHYRKRDDGSSAIGGQTKNRDFYLVVPKLAYGHMMDTWRGSDGHVYPFMQYGILSDLYWRIIQRSQSVLSPKEEKEYKNTIKRLVDQIDDKTILTKRGLGAIYKVFFLKMKYGKDFDKKLQLKEGGYYFDDKLLLSIRRIATLHVDFFTEINENEIKIEGYITDDNISKRGEYFIKTSLGIFKLRQVDRSQRLQSFLGEVIDDGGGFETTIKLADLSEKDHIMAGLSFTNKELPIAIETNQFSGFSIFPQSYKSTTKRLFRRENKTIRVYPKSALRHIVFELRFLVRVMTNIKIRQALIQLKRLQKRNLKFLNWKAKLFEVSKPLLILGESVLMIPQSLALRILYHLISSIKRHQIWIVSDRGMAGGDNGEAFFRYAVEQEDLDAAVYYVISKKSKDYNRLKQYGKVLNQDGFKYKLLFLLSDKVISSQADTEITNPYFRQLHHVVDLMKFDFIFLQHGVIRHDLSGWLNRFNKNISLFVTSAPIEYKSILDHSYYYSKNDVILTGLPRFDLLESKPQGKLILAPTYRKNLVKNRTNKNGARAYDPSFKESDYFKFYNALMNDKHVIKTLKDSGMVGELYLHPALAAQIEDFTANPNFIVKDFPYDYKTAFTEGSLMVSDYSSVVFDFAYLKKPIIYAHFDSETFFHTQLYDKSDLFSDDKDGFGPVTYNYDSLVNEINNSIKNNCVMKDKYKKRVDTFFYKNDKNNTQRVYNAVRKT